MARGFPERVPAWYMGPRGATMLIISFLPPNAPTGSPPPIIFPRHVISGVTPYLSCAPPMPSLKPVMTSSKMRSEPESRVIFLSPSRNPSAGGTTPILAATGSSITAAILSRYLSYSPLTEPRSLKLASSVFSVNDSGTPGLLGVPNVVAPDPA